jgi:hypothetical protein
MLDQVSGKVTTESRATNGRHVPPVETFRQAEVISATVSTKVTEDQNFLHDARKEVTGK